MSFENVRPAYLLRFRHTEQYLEIQRLAERARLSVNEFILRILEGVK